MMKKSVTVMAILICTFFILTSTSFAEQISSDSYFGCTSKEYHNKLVGYAVAKDMEAFKKGLMAGMLAGQCIMFKTGEEVHIVDTAIFSGMVKVRKRGSISEYWTNIEAVK